VAPFRALLVREALDANLGLVAEAAAGWSLTRQKPMENRRKGGLLGCVLTWGIVNGGKVRDEIMARCNGVRGRCNFVVVVNSGWAA
jgi:hypothetical protein